MDITENRIAIIIDELCDGNKSVFARKIGITPQYAAQLYSGVREPSKRTVNDICKKYGVDEVWLRTGVGAMFRPRTREDEITAFFADLLSPDATDFQRDFVAILATLSPEAWDLMEKKLNELAELSRRRQENEK